MSSRIVRKLVVFSAITAPIAALSIRAYLYDHPLSSNRTRTIKTSGTLSPSCASSASLDIINPRQHQAWTDSSSFSFSNREIGNASDEELLSRFVKGFFGGWVFAAENNILMMVHAFGRQVIPTGFSNIDTRCSPMVSVADLSRTSLPPKHSLLFGGNFLVLDVYLKSADNDAVHNNDVGDDSMSGSHIDIAFGDDRKGFAGFHRFEITREKGSDFNNESGGATICYSSAACNPSVDRLPAPSFTYAFHKFYAQTLFRDGIAGALQTA